MTDDSDDRGLHNRSLFSETLHAKGVMIRTAGLEAPSQLVRAERHGGFFKTNLQHVVTVHKVIGKKAMKMAVALSISYKNELMRKGGIAPCQ